MAELQKSYHEVNYVEALTKKMTAEKHDELFFYRGKEFSLAHARLKFILSEKEMLNFDKIKSNLKELSLYFQNICFKYSLRDSTDVIYERKDQLYSEITRIEREDDKYMVEAGKDFQKKYN
jgi:hypothetical protein